eukprot:c28482_g1_i3 orf=369-2429(-)
MKLACLIVLTQEQRNRIVRQKELALARRSAKELRELNFLRSISHCIEAEQQTIIEDTDIGVSSKSTIPGEELISHDFKGGTQSELQEEALGVLNTGVQTAVIVTNNAKEVSQHVATPEPVQVRESQKLDYKDDKFSRRHNRQRDVEPRISELADSNGTTSGGWISVRKRPIPGHSFWREIRNSSWGDNAFVRRRRDVPIGDRKNEIKRAELDSRVEEFSRRKEKSIGDMMADSKSEELGKRSGPISLSMQQMKVLKAIAQLKSVFITGSAGTGKSYLLEFAVRILQRNYGADSVFVTASTGLAACALGGTTLHSFAGIGLGMGSKEVLADKVRSKRAVRKRWMDAKALIVDEISMIDGELFDKLEYVARVARSQLGKEKVFGGLQLIVTGDFFQLPPVSPENPQKYFAFEADCWNRCFDLQIELTHVFRQSDSDFVSMLNELRKGDCQSTTIKRLQGCMRPVDDCGSGIVLTRLYPRKVDVTRENDQKLNALNIDTFVFLAKDVGHSEFAMRQLDNVRAVKELSLCVGAQVMLVKNLDTGLGLVNGARGVVVRFIPVDDKVASQFKNLANSVSPSGVWPVVRFACDSTERIVGPESWSVMEGDREIANRSQVPLILAWALSVHKCQGMTLDRVETDLSKAFDYGMVYVALSRVRCLDGLQLVGFDPSLIKVHPKVVCFYEGLKTAE